MKTWLSMPRAKTTTHMCGAAALPVGPGLTVRNQYVPSESVLARPKPRNFSLPIRIAAAVVTLARSQSWRPGRVCGLHPSPCPRPGSRVPAVSLPASRFPATARWPRAARGQGVGKKTALPSARGSAGAFAHTLHGRGPRSSQHDVEFESEGPLRLESNRERSSTRASSGRQGRARIRGSDRG